MGGFGLGGVVEQLADLKLGELLDSPPPGFDEAVAISKVGRARLGPVCVGGLWSVVVWCGVVWCGVGRRSPRGAAPG